MTYYSDRMDELKGPAKKPKKEFDPTSTKVRTTEPRSKQRAINEGPEVFVNGWCAVCGEACTSWINGWRVCNSERCKFMAWSF